MPRPELDRGLRELQPIPFGMALDDVLADSVPKEGSTPPLESLKGVADQLAGRIPLFSEIEPAVRYHAEQQGLGEEAVNLILLGGLAAMVALSQVASREPIASKRFFSAVD